MFVLLCGPIELINSDCKSGSDDSNAAIQTSIINRDFAKRKMSN